MLFLHNNRRKIEIPLRKYAKMFSRALLPLLTFGLGFTLSTALRLLRNARTTQSSSDRKAMALAMAVQNSHERYEDAVDKLMYATKVASKVVNITFPNGLSERYLNIQLGCTAIHIPIPDGTHFGPPDLDTIDTEVLYAYDIGHHRILVVNGDYGFKVCGPAGEIYVFDMESHEAAVELFNLVMDAARILAPP